jgi:hypothetical protein
MKKVVQDFCYEFEWHASATCKTVESTLISVIPGTLEARSRRISRRMRRTNRLAGLNRLLERT